MTRNSSLPKPAFTLIELLVVVAIITVLISILLPALSRAREQAKTSKCLANLSSLGKAMTMYGGDHKDWFPFEKKNWPLTNGNPGPLGGGFPMSAFYYAGHPGRPTDGDQISYTFDQPNLRDTFRGRAFNPYMYPAEGLYDVLEQITDADTPEFEERRKQMTITQCPSDVGGFFSNETAADTGQYRTIWELNGSSYDLNYHYAWMWASRTRLDASIPPYAPPNPPAGDRRLYMERANRFLSRQREKNAGRFIVLYEDPFDSAQIQRIGRFGWHKQYNKHSFLFLDSHAANIYTDTTAGNFGPGWKTSSLAWYNDPDDPDYELRTLP